MNLQFKIGGQKLVLSLNNTKTKTKNIKKEDSTKTKSVKKTDNPKIKKETGEKTNTDKKVKKDTVKKEGRIRKAIPKQVRNLVWEKYNGRSMDGHCFCCQGVIKLENWHVGHYISAKNGGSDEITNLRPLCVACNLSMSDTDMDIFMLLYGMQQNQIRNNN